jgi:hypothetical protein
MEKKDGGRISFIRRRGGAERSFRRKEEGKRKEILYMKKKDGGRVSFIIEEGKEQKDPSEE